MSNSTLLLTPRRSTSAPDLWVPYVLIGSSCVTFLAVHFWCYHKRNRERYLRQREEKQLKFGLMERRRIATLIIERYQSDLDKNPGTTDVNLPQTHSDSNLECVGGDHEDSGHDKQPFPDVTKEDTSTPTIPDLAVAAEATSSHSFDHWPTTSGAKTLANSRSWPLIGDNQIFVGSAHPRCPQNIRSFRSHGLGQPVPSRVLKQTSSSVLANHDISTVNTHEASPVVRNNHSATGRRLTSLQISNTAASTDRNTMRAAEMAPADVRVPRQQTASKPSAPSRHRSNVFYTDISATIQHAATPLFTWKHSKRRYDGSYVGGSQISRHDKHTASLTFNQWRHYKAHKSERIRLTSFYNHGVKTASDNYGYANGHLDKAILATRPSFGAGAGEASYSGQIDPAAADTGQTTHILQDTGRGTGLAFQCPPHTNTRPEDSSLCPEKRVLALHTDSNRDAGLQANEINNQSVSHGPSYLSRHYLAGSDRSSSETGSVTFGKVSGAVGRYPAPQVCLAGPQGPGEARASRSDISQAGSRIQSQTVPTYKPDHRPTARPQVWLPEQSRLPSVCENVSFLVHRTHISASRQGGPRGIYGHAVSETDIDSTTRTVPRLRALDPNLTFNYTQRYSSP